MLQLISDFGKMFDDLKITSMIEMINNIHERAEEYLEIAQKYKENPR